MGGLQGKERRSYGPGRRATDQTTQGAMPWVRVLLLAIALVITAYAVLVIRDDSRPRREAQAMRIEALGLEARLAATRIEARLAATARAMTLAGRDLSERPEQAVEALDLARAVAPDAAFALLDRDGNILAAIGGKTDAATARQPLGAYALSDDALSSRRSVDGGGSIIARTPLPPLDAGLKGASLSVVQAGQAPADAARAVKGPDGKARLTASAPIVGTGHAVVAALPVAGGMAAWLDDAWLLVAP